MKKMTLGLLASMMLLPVLSFAQTRPQPPASWVAFQQQETAKRDAFFKQMDADTKAFLNANPDVKAYLDQLRALSNSQMAAWQAAHHQK